MEILRNRSNHRGGEANKEIEAKDRMPGNAMWKLGHVAFVDP
jgi:hypothetical protein